MSKKILAIIIAVVILLSVAGGGYYLFAKKAASTDNSQDMIGTPEQVFPKISKDEIGLSMSATPDKKKVKFAIAKTNGIKSIDYELTYEADASKDGSDEGEDTTGRIQRGVTGTAKSLTTGTPYESQYLDLGSCSKNVCRYDTGVKSVSLVLKITKNDGKIYQANDSINL